MLQKPVSSLISLVVLLGSLTACGNQATNPFSVTFRVEPDPPKVGSGHLIFSVFTFDGKPVDDISIEISMSMTSMQMSAQSGIAEFVGKGVYTKMITFHTKGKYVLQVYFNRDGRTILQKEFKFDIN